MDNKVLVKIIVPELDSEYDVYLPVNKRIGNILCLLNQGLNDITKGAYPIMDHLSLYNAIKEKSYDINDLLLKTDIRNGSILIFTS